jgi:6,7-dimethyl-8-ribityllumazine synthase
MQVQLHSRKPVIYGLLTVNTEQEAFDRAGGIHGNKGTEAAATLLHQMQLKQHIDQL